MAARRTGIAVVMLMAMSVGSCSWLGAADPSAPIVPNPEEPVTVTLFFAEPFGALLVAEEREITSTPAGLPEAILRALIAGPGTDGLHPTVPGETRVLGVEVVDGTAFANFSRELIDKHWGGSVGEILTVRSVVYSLTRLAGIERVQFLIDGVVPPETLLGHLDAREPFEPDLAVGPLVQDPNRLAGLQRRVDGGADQWRLDPVEVLIRDGQGAGLFISRDDLLRMPAERDTGSGHVSVLVAAYGRQWGVNLVQPVRTGQGGIWALDEIIPHGDD